LENSQHLLWLRKTCREMGGSTIGKGVLKPLRGPMVSKTEKSYHQNKS